MGSVEDIKPAIPSDDRPDQSSLTAPLAGVGKFKYSRYEDVWPEDVHAAFMEAVALYPPMGKRRLKYYRVSTHENEHPDVNRAKSFGRCQLIQSYILEKTGKNRTRKQVSSHLQRLKKIYRDNSAMQPLFSERPHLPSEHCSGPQVIPSQESSIPSSTNVSVNAGHLKSELDFSINLQDIEPWPVDSSTFTTACESSSLNGGPSSCHAFKTSTREQHTPHRFLSPVSQLQIVASHSSDSDYLSESQDTVNQGLGSGIAFNASGFSTSLRRLAPQHGRLIDSSPAIHLSRAVHSLGFQPTHQHHWISHDGFADGVYYNSPLTPTQESFHTPIHSLQLVPSEKQKLCPGLASEWLWPKNSDLSFNLREGPFAELCLRYRPTMYQYNHPEMKVDASGFNSFPYESGMPRPPRVLSYPYAMTSPAIGEISHLSRGISCSYSTTNLATASDENAIDSSRQSPEPSENPVSSFLMRPTAVYPVSYVHSNIHSDDLTQIPILPP